VVFGDEIIISQSRDPEHDLARALLARGISGVVEVRNGRTGRSRCRVNIETAAKIGIGSNLDRYAWKPSEIGKDSPLTDETRLPGIQTVKAA
jgi:hypothetical protein